ncbi:MAG: sulfatase-like hydrolase/transferase [Rikenellaceae bacterium]
MKKEILAGTIALTLIPTLSIGAQKNEKPNIVFIFADDHSYECVGDIGRDKVITPNLDRLLKNGTHFTHAFNQGAWHGAVSVASRSMLATGANLWKVNDVIKTNNANQNDASYVHRPYWTEMIKKEGYDTYFTGKWHVNGVKVDEVFDTAKNVRGGMADQHDDCYNREFIEGTPDKWTSYDESYGGQWQGGKHWAEVVKDDAVEYMDMVKDSDNPFFMYLAFNSPHDPRQAPKEFFDKYSLDDITVSENFVGKYEFADDIGCSVKLRDERLAPFPRTEYSVKLNRKEYYAMITHMDHQIGEILDALEKSGKMDNTYIIYTADHGISIGDHGFLGKQNQYDASVRVPFIVVGPDVPKNKQIDDLIYVQDAMATTLDIAGSDGTEIVDFKSVLPLINDKKAEKRDAVYGAYMTLQRMIRTEEYKMIIYPDINVVRLYNIKKDPLEMVDLAKNSKYRKTLEQLFKQFKELQVEVEDKLDVTAAFNAFMAK